MKAVVAAFNQEKALVGAFSVLTNLRMELFQALTRKLARLSPSSAAMAASLVRVAERFFMKLSPARMVTSGSAAHQ